MAFGKKKQKQMKEEPAEKAERPKILDVDASMQGSMTFRDPVNLRINGKFEGSLDTKGSLTIGEHAHVRANIIGENIVVAGKVTGDVTASSSLGLTATAHLVGDIHAPRLSVSEGAILQGKCEMSAKEAKVSRSTMQEMMMTVDELARYLEVDSASISEWAKSGRIPAQKEGSAWKFDRNRIDSWIASEKIK